MDGSIREAVVGLLKRVCVLLVSNILVELFFPTIDSLLNLLRFGEASLDYERGAEMFVLYFLLFIYVSRLFGVEFEHHHFTPYFFGAGLLRYLYNRYASTYFKHAQTLTLQTAAHISQVCLTMERRTVAMLAAFLTASTIIILVRLDRRRAFKRRDAGRSGKKRDLSHC